MTGVGASSVILASFSGLAAIVAGWFATKNYLTLKSRSGALEQDMENASDLDRLKWSMASLYTAAGILFAQFLFGISSSDLLPPPSSTLLAFLGMLSSASFYADFFSSVFRIIVGFSLAALVGTAMGLFGGAFMLGRSILGPVTSFLRYIPPTAFIALFIVYFGVDETYKMAVVFFGVLFFIVQMVFDVVDDLDRHYYEMGKVSGLSDWDIFTLIIVPASWPRIVDVWRINLGAAWTFLVAAEIVGANSGLGHRLAVSQRFNDMPQLFACILTFGLIGLAMDVSLRQLSRKLFPWQRIALHQ